MILDNVYREEFQLLVEFLKHKDIEINSQIEVDIKHLHKKLMAFKALIEIISKNTSEDEKLLYLLETQSDLLQVLPLLVKNEYKPSQQMIRSGIDNFCKFLVDYFYTDRELSAIKTVYELFEVVYTLKDAIRGVDLQDYFQKIRDNYVYLCNYVHSSGKQFCYLYEVLSDTLEYNEDVFKDTKRRIIIVLNSMIFILATLAKEWVQSSLNQNYYLLIDNLERQEYDKFIGILNPPRVLYTKN